MGLSIGEAESRGAAGWEGRGRTHPQDGDEPPAHPAPLHRRGRPARGGAPGSPRGEKILAEKPFGSPSPPTGMLQGIPAAVVPHQKVFLEVLWDARHHPLPLQIPTPS